MRFFNTASPVDPARHYRITPPDRLELAEVLTLVEQQKYFVLDAPARPARPAACWRWDTSGSDP